MDDVAISLKSEPTKSLDFTPESVTSAEVKLEAKEASVAMDSGANQDIERVSDDAVNLKTDRELGDPKDEETASLKTDGETESQKDRETVSQDDDETISLKDEAEGACLEDEIRLNSAASKAEFADVMEKPKAEEDGATVMDVAEDGVLNLATTKRQALVEAAGKAEVDDACGKENERSKVEKKVAETRNDGGEVKNGEGKSEEAEKIMTPCPDVRRLLHFSSLSSFAVWLGLLLVRCLSSSLVLDAGHLAAMGTNI